jgi:hypothetical protein
MGKLEAVGWRFRDPGFMPPRTSPPLRVHRRINRTSATIITPIINFDPQSLNLSLTSCHKSMASLDFGEGGRKFFMRGVNKLRIICNRWGDQRPQFLDPFRRPFAHFGSLGRPIFGRPTACTSLAVVTHTPPISSARNRPASRQRFTVLTLTPKSSAASAMLR